MEMIWLSAAGTVVGLIMQFVDFVREGSAEELTSGSRACDPRKVRGVKTPALTGPA